MFSSKYSAWARKYVFWPLMDMTPLTCDTQLTPIGRSDMGQFKMLMRLIVTNAFSASNTLSADDSTYVANIARDTCDDNRGMQDDIKWNHFPCYWPFVRGNHWSSVNSPAQRQVTRSFDVLFEMRLNKRLSKQWWGWWFETPSRPLWHHCNGWNTCVAHKDAGFLKVE